MARTAKLEPLKIVMPQRPEVTDALLGEIAQRIVNAFQPEKVILFGSYAYGTPHKDSDVDLFVIWDSDLSMTQRMIAVKSVAQYVHLPMDVLVYTPREVEVRLAIGDFFIRGILEKGKRLYERDAGRRMDRESGNGL